MANLDLSKYGITDVKEIVHNPSYDVLFAEETKSTLEGYEKGQVTELGAVNVMTGIYARPKTNSSYTTRPARTPYGGLPTNIRTTTSLAPKRHGLT